MTTSEWKPDYSKTPRIVVCAANRHRETGLLLCGARHWDKVMRAQAVAAGLGFTGYDQGFIDQFGDFMDRETAWRVADIQGQIRNEVSTEGTLYSENLY